MEQCQHCTGMQMQNKDVFWKKPLKLLKQIILYRTISVYMFEFKTDSKHEEHKFVIVKRKKMEKN